MVPRTRYYHHIWAQSIETLRYMPEGRGFDSRWYYWNFSLKNHSDGALVLGSTQPLTEMSTRNIYWRGGGRDKGGRCVRLTTLPSSYADCLEIWEPQPPGTLRACPGLYKDYFQFTSISITFHKSQ